MRASDFEVEQRLLVIRSLLRERGERVGDFENRRFAGAIAGDGNVDVAARIGDGGAGVVDAPNRRERFFMRGGELLLEIAPRDVELVLRGLRFQLGLTLFRASDSPVEDRDVERGGGEVAAMLANVRGMQRGRIETLVDSVGQRWKPARARDANVRS